LEMAVKTAQDDKKLASLSANILKMALPNSAEIIADAVIEMAERQQ